MNVNNGINGLPSFVDSMSQHYVQFGMILTAAKESVLNFLTAGVEGTSFQDARSKV